MDGTYDIPFLGFSKGDYEFSMNDGVASLEMTPVFDFRISYITLTYTLMYILIKIFEL